MSMQVCSGVFSQNCQKNQAAVKKSPAANFSPVADTVNFSSKKANNKLSFGWGIFGKPDPAKKQAEIAEKKAKMIKEAKEFMPKSTDEIDANEYGKWCVLFNQVKKDLTPAEIKELQKAAETGNKNNGLPQLIKSEFPKSVED